MVGDVFQKTRETLRLFAKRRPTCFPWINRADACDAKQLLPYWQLLKGDLYVLQPLLVWNMCMQNKHEQKVDFKPDFPSKTLKVNAANEVCSCPRNHAVPGSRIVPLPVIHYLPCVEPGSGFSRSTTLIHWALRCWCRPPATVLQSWFAFFISVIEIQSLVPFFIVVLTLIFAPQIWCRLGVLSICALCRLLDSMQEIPAHGKSSSGDVPHPGEKR